MEHVWRPIVNAVLVILHGIAPRSPAVMVIRWLSLLYIRSALKMGEILWILVLKMSSDSVKYTYLNTLLIKNTLLYNNKEARSWNNIRLFYTLSRKHEVLELNLQVSWYEYISLKGLMWNWIYTPLGGKSLKYTVLWMR